MKHRVKHSAHIKKVAAKKARGVKGRAKRAAHKLAVKA
jgi:hypothetical protein